MALFTVLLLNRCVKDKQVVMGYIEEILKIMENPEDEHAGIYLGISGERYYSLWMNPK